MTAVFKGKIGRLWEEGIAVIIRRLKASETEKAVRMSEFAFQYELTDTERRTRMADIKPHETWVAEEDGEILSKLTILPMCVFIHGEPVDAAGVSSVATWPEHRRKGLVTLLLEHALEEMRKSGRVLSLLYPFSIPFYRKFGWELFADQEILTLERHQFPVHEAHKGYCRRLNQDGAVLAPVYLEWARKHNGTLMREEEWWRKSVFRRKKGSIAGYYRNNQLYGYMIYEMKNRHMRVEELIWLDPDARKGLFSFIANHDSMADTISLKVPAHEITPFLLPDPKVKRDMTSYFMARITDCRAMLEDYPFKLQKHESLVLHITDGICSWNEGTYIISADAEGRKRLRSYAKPQSSEKLSPKILHEGLYMNINTLAALLLGAQNPLRLWEEGCITGSREAAVQLHQSVPSASTAFYDFF